MSDWKQIVGEYFGQSNGAQQFIKDVKAHISTYQAMRETDKRHPDPKDTFENLLDIQEKAQELGMTLMKSDRQVAFHINEGKFLTENAPDEPVDVERLGKELVYMARAIDSVVAEIGDDQDVKRRGGHKHTARNMLVKSVCESYSERLNEFPSASDPRFAAIIETILESLGLPRSNLHRVLKDSIPPSPNTH